MINIVDFNIYGYKEIRTLGLKWKDTDFDNGLMVLSDIHVKEGNREIYKSNLKNNSSNIIYRLIQRR